MAGAAARPVGEVLVNAADITVTGFGREPELRRGVLGGLGLEERALDEHAGRARGDFAALAAHDAGDGAGLLGVCDHEHRLVELALHAVERLDRLAGGRVAYDDLTARERLVVERVHGLAALEHHVVRHVHEQTKRAHAARLEALGHEIGRGAVLDARHDAGRVARAADGV